MKIKPVVPREQANRDVEAATDWYLSEATPEAAVSFVTAIEKAYGHIGRDPATGSSRYAHELNLPGPEELAADQLPVPRLLRRESRPY